MSTNLTQNETTQMGLGKKGQKNRTDFRSVKKRKIRSENPDQLLGGRRKDSHNEMWGERREKGDGEKRAQ